MVSPIKLNTAISGCVNQQNSIDLKSIFYKHIERVDRTLKLSLFEQFYNITDKMNKEVVKLDVGATALGVCKLLDVLKASTKNFSSDMDDILQLLNGYLQPDIFSDKENFLKALFFEALNSDLKNKNIILTIVSQEFVKIEDDYFINAGDHYWSEENLFEFLVFLRKEVESNYKSWKNYFDFEQKPDILISKHLDGYFYSCVTAVTKIIISATIAGFDTERLRNFICDKLTEKIDPFLSFRCKLTTENLRCITDFRTADFNYEITSHLVNPVIISNDLHIKAAQARSVNQFALMRFYIKKIARFDKKLAHAFISLSIVSTPIEALTRKIIYYFSTEPRLFTNYDLSVWLKNVQVPKTIPVNFFENNCFIDQLYNFILTSPDLENFEMNLNVYFAVFSLCKKMQFEKRQEFLDRMTTSFDDFILAFTMLPLKENFDLSLRILNKYLNLDVKLNNMQLFLGCFPPYILSTRILSVECNTEVAEKQNNQIKKNLNQDILSAGTAKETIYKFDNLYRDCVNLNLPDYLKSMIDMIRPLITNDKFHVLESLLNFYLNVFDLKDENIYIRLTILIRRLIEESAVKQLNLKNQRALYDYQWRLILKKLDTEPKKIIEILFSRKILLCTIEISLDDVQNKWIPLHYLELKFAINQAEEFINPTFPDELLNKIVVDAPFLSDEYFLNYLNLKTYVIPYIVDYDLVLDVFYEFRQCFCVSRPVDLNQRLREGMRLRQLVSTFEALKLEKSHPYFVKVMPHINKLIDLWIDTVSINFTSEHHISETYRKYQKENKKLLSDLEKNIAKEHLENTKSFKNTAISLKVYLDEKLGKIKQQKAIEKNKKEKATSKKDNPKKTTRHLRKIAKEKTVLPSTATSSSTTAKLPAEELVEIAPKIVSLEELFSKFREAEKETVIDIVFDIMKLISKIDLLQERLSYYEKLAENMSRSIASLTVKFLIKKCSKTLDVKEKDKLFFFIIKHTRSPKACNRAFKNIESDIIKEEAKLEDSKKKIPLLIVDKDPVAGPSRPVLERRNTIYGIAPVDIAPLKKLKRASSRSNVMEASFSRQRSNSFSGNGLGAFFDVKESIRKYKGEIKEKPKTLDELNACISLIPGIENYKFELKNVRGSHFRFGLTDINKGMNFGTTTIATHGKDITKENIMNIYEQIYAFIRTCQDLKL